MKELIRRGCRIEVGCTVRGRPSYRWVQGWQVLDPRTGRWSVEMRYRYALMEARELSSASKENQ